MATTGYIEFEDRAPQTWGDAFPWLAGAAGSGAAPWWRLPIGDATPAQRGQFLAQIAELAMQRLTRWSIGQIFPGLPAELDLQTLDGLPRRAALVLRRNRCESTADLMGVQLDDLLGWWQMGVGTTDALLQLLAGLSTSAPTPRVTSGPRRSVDANPTPDDASQGSDQPDQTDETPPSDGQRSPADLAEGDGLPQTFDSDELHQAFDDFLSRIDDPTPSSEPLTGESSAPAWRAEGGFGKAKETVKSDRSGETDALPRWCDVFPWIPEASQITTLPWWDLPIGHPTSRERREGTGRIAKMAMERLDHWTVAQLYPSIPADLDLTEVGSLPTRAVNALTRHHCARSSSLAHVTVREMLEWRAVGVGTVEAILRVLVELAVEPPTSDALTLHVATQTPIGGHTDAVRLPNWVASLVEDLGIIATWFGTVGHPSQPLLGNELPPSTPADVVKAHLRVRELTPGDILTTAEVELDIAAHFDAALELLEPRACEVLRARLFADEPATLDEIGRRQGVTRERIRQIEGKARGTLLSSMTEEGPIAAVAEAARSIIGTIRPLDDLLTLIPALGRTVELAGQPAWRVLDRLDDVYEIEEGWCVVPTLTAAAEATAAQLQERADQYGVVRLEELDLVEGADPAARASSTLRWITERGYLVDRGHVLTRTGSVNDYAAAILSMQGEPMSAQQIVDRFQVERSTNSLKNALSIDDRFERVDRDSWALREWGMEAYGSIRSVIRRELAQAGGAIGIDALVERITGRYSVSASSVIAYASNAPFELRGGTVRAAGTSREARKTPEQTSRLYRRPNAWIYRVRVTHDHLRGSGSTAPVAVTSLLGMEQGDKALLRSRLGDQAIHWSGFQPAFGTIRRFLVDADVAAGTEVFLVIGDDRTFDVEVIEGPDGNALQSALRLVGAPEETSSEAARASLATAIRLPTATPIVSIIGAYRDRGDSDVAELLTGVRRSLAAADGTPAAVEEPAVNDIMDLL
ncbi:sigma factor-like helix-turn-helix DNA-binding protein [Nocardioides sp. YIM 152588]|uniref:sigma factor-like helix-turn-helix DNA-binding protein n=1 Tax=Nocardioides sp. YIM 152588 TaxID=3158259 RepID=UPI0032E3748D